MSKGGIREQPHKQQSSMSNGKNGLTEQMENEAFWSKQKCEFQRNCVALELTNTVCVFLKGSTRDVRNYLLQGETNKLKW